MPTVPGIGAEVAHTYSFSLDSANILNTRSQKTDTDYASFTVRVNPAQGQSWSMTETIKLGDLATGSHPVNLRISKVKIAPADQVIVNYLIVNSGHTDPTKTQATIKNAGSQLSTTAQVVNTVANLSEIGRVLDVMKAIVDLLGDIFGGIFSGPNCDGTVAARQEVLTGAQLQSAGTAGLARTTTDPGSDSPHGCGKNSVYEVTWRVKQDPVLATAH